ncbi:hypothetical protein [Acinetobacter equi]|uniref:Uncharacterized protein n=1 Tax=Acinetobacter equi TaxID=1324350 RepID=A0A0N9VE78_9GAMM|nr:hypothetical protein [Acinetobacter equi]ALH95678.1 hypothetical protein AOY20_09120 [Acinetobacter equi]
MGGKFEVKAGQHQFKTGEKVVSHFPILPEINNGIFNLSIQLTNNENMPYCNKAYFAVTESGKRFEGVTDDNGYTQRIYTEREELVYFHLLENHDYPDQIQSEDE